MASRLQKSLLLMAALGAAAVIATSSQPSSRDWQPRNIANGNGFTSTSTGTLANVGPVTIVTPKTFDPSEIPAALLGMDPARAKRFIVIHGVLASIAFVALLPLGSILIRIVPSKSAWIAHAVAQTLGYAMYVAGAGIGIYLVSAISIPYPEPNTSLLELDTVNYHFTIGLVVLVVLLFQPLTGVVHHIKYKRAKTAAAAGPPNTLNNRHHQQQHSRQHSSSSSTVPPGKEYNNNGANGTGTYIPRTTWSHVHIWLGRLAVTLGMVNGGLGLYVSSSDSDPKTNALIAYSVVAGVVWLVWLASVVYGEVSRAKGRSAEKKKPRDMRIAEGAYTGGNIYTGASNGGMHGYAVPRNGGGGGGGGGGGPGASAGGYNARSGGAQISEPRQPHDTTHVGDEAHTTPAAPFYRTPPAAPSAPVPTPALASAPAADSAPPPAEAQQSAFSMLSRSTSSSPPPEPQPQPISQPQAQPADVPSRNDPVSPLSVYAVRY